MPNPFDKESGLTYDAYVAAKKAEDPQVVPTPVDYVVDYIKSDNRDIKRDQGRISTGDVSRFLNQLSSASFTMSNEALAQKLFEAQAQSKEAMLQCAHELTAKFIQATENTENEVGVHPRILNAFKERATELLGEEADPSVVRHLALKFSDAYPQIATLVMVQMVTKPLEELFVKAGGKAEQTMDDSVDWTPAEIAKQRVSHEVQNPINRQMREEPISVYLPEMMARALKDGRIPEKTTLAGKVFVQKSGQEWNVNADVTSRFFNKTGFSPKISSDELAKEIYDRRANLKEARAYFMDQLYDMLKQVYDISYDAQKGMSEVISFKAPLKEALREKITTQMPGASEEAINTVLAEVTSRSVASAVGELNGVFSSSLSKLFRAEHDDSVASVQYTQLTTALNQDLASFQGVQRHFNAVMRRTQAGDRDRLRNRLEGEVQEKIDQIGVILDKHPVKPGELIENNELAELVKYKGRFDALLRMVRDEKAGLSVETKDKFFSMAIPQFDSEKASFEKALPKIKAKLNQSVEVERASVEQLLACVKEARTILSQESTAVEEGKGFPHANELKEGISAYDDVFKRIEEKLTEALKENKVISQTFLDSQKTAIRQATSDFVKNTVKSTRIDKVRKFFVDLIGKIAARFGKTDVFKNTNERLEKRAKLRDAEKIITPSAPVPEMGRPSARRE
ncbi:MAG: hypothetical protein HY939_03890 [Gammaproteobacteria bacterium]|nr:hypothetical protein [Gammaproteobacteria bacterium]